jgi:hypothetical protein
MRGVCQTLQRCTRGFVQKKSGPVRPRCERGRKIPVVGGAVACAVAGIRFAAEVIYTLPDNSGRWRDNSGPRRGRCEPCRKIPVVDGAILCACAGIPFAAEVIYPLPENSGRGRRNSGRRRNNSGERRENSTRCAVACVSGQSECARKWTLRRSWCCFPESFTARRL